MLILSQEAQFSKNQTKQHPAQILCRTWSGYMVIALTNRGALALRELHPLFINFMHACYEIIDRDFFVEDAFPDKQPYLQGQICLQCSGRCSQGHQGACVAGEGTAGCCLVAAYEESCEFLSYLYFTYSGGQKSCTRLATGNDNMLPCMFQLRKSQLYSKVDSYM